jgi:hypothetical protein
MDNSLQVCNNKLNGFFKKVYNKLSGFFLKRYNSNNAILFISRDYFYINQTNFIAMKIDVR